MTSPPALAVRFRREEDLPVLVEVLGRVTKRHRYPVTPPPDPVAWLTGSRTRSSFVATLGGRVVGQVSRAVAEGDLALEVWTCALGCTPAELAVVKRLFVDPEAGGLGAGRLLLQAVVADAHALGLTPVLDVDAASERARRMYELAGFRLVGELELTWAGLDGSLAVACYAGPPPPGSPAPAAG
ncbi:MAG TPA: GNAT family N-acetyltransferase [Acidimicrobiales bacterium]|nr:GNAT family N-acetyltransferase [Acidimicrobiales bacterium]